MITPQLDNNGSTGSILIEPNRPINWQANLFFMKSFFLVSLIISLVAFYLGFLLVMPYSGIEVIFVCISLYIAYKRYSICEVIYFTPNSVIIESGNHYAEKKIKYQRYWSKFIIDTCGNYDIPRISITSKGKTTEIGRFLNHKDKLILISLVKDITKCFQSNTC